MDRAFRGVGLGIICGMVLLAMTTGQAWATFIVDTSPGGEKFYNGSANKDVGSFTGNVGAQSSGPMVTVTTTGNVDTGAGFSTITPVKGGSLTDLVFTPASPTLFKDFSFRGQVPTDNDVITLNVWDSMGTEFTFTFNIAKKNADFDRIGVVSTDGETIEKVELSLANGFNEVKEVEFSAVPVPPSLLLLAPGLFGLVGLRRKFFG